MTMRAHRADRRVATGSHALPGASRRRSGIAFSIAGSACFCPSLCFFPYYARDRAGLSLARRGRRPACAAAAPAPSFIAR